MNFTDYSKLCLNTWNRNNELELQYNKLLEEIRDNDIYTNINFKQFTFAINSLKLQLCNAVLGLGEIEEFKDELSFYLYDRSEENKLHLIDEFGDILYYFSILCHLLNINPTEDTFNNLINTDINNLLDFIISDILDLQNNYIKKICFHIKTDETIYSKIENKYTELYELLFDIWSNLKLLSNKLELDIEEVMQYNITKLSKRHNNSGFNANY